MYRQVNVTYDWCSFITLCAEVVIVACSELPLELMVPPVEGQLFAETMVAVVW